MMSQSRLAAALWRGSRASSAARFRYLCSSSSEGVNNEGLNNKNNQEKAKPKMKGNQATTADHQDPLFPSLVISVKGVPVLSLPFPTEKTNWKQKGKEAANQSPKLVQDGSSSDAAEDLDSSLEVGEDLDSALEVFAAMEKEKKRAGRKGAVFTLLKAFGTDLVSIGQPFYSSYMEAVKLVAKKLYACEDRLIVGFDMPRGCDEKSIGIRVTPLEVLEVRGRKEGGIDFLWEWPLPQQINFRNAKFFYECNPRQLMVIITNYEWKVERIIKKGSS